MTFVYEWRSSTLLSSHQNALMPTESTKAIPQEGLAEDYGTKNKPRYLKSASELIEGLLIQTCFRFAIITFTLATWVPDSGVPYCAQPSQVGKKCESRYRIFWAKQLLNSRVRLDLLAIVKCSMSYCSWPSLGCFREKQRDP